MCDRAKSSKAGLNEEKLGKENISWEELLKADTRRASSARRTIRETEEKINQSRKTRDKMLQEILDKIEEVNTALDNSTELEIRISYKRY
jgi:septal ring factor EnvC (AmiA/AmiB activator)